MNAVLTDPRTIWALAAVVVVAVVAPYVVAFRRRRHADRERLAEARDLGIDRPVAQYPFIDAMDCIGCGACVRACPEGDVLGIVGGIAVVINGLRCVGHGRCADACPVGAIEIGLGDVKGRRDVPVLTDDLETTLPGVFVAGELAGLALIRNAIDQGARVVEVITRRLRALSPAADPGVADLVVVGAGPAGISAALAARRAGLRCRVVDQGEGLGGTILHFPRRKLVLTRPVELPGGGKLAREEYSKEDLLELLHGEIERHRLDIHYGEKLERIEQGAGELVVRTSAAAHRARFVVLALGRRGSPRRLGVPGEERSRVMYQLRDAESYRRQRILVVGGGDSAIEAALGLARQAGNQVTISYRKAAFHRIKRKNQEAIEAMIQRGRVHALFESEVESIGEADVRVRTKSGVETLENDYVFVFIGGDPPYELLRGFGVRFGGDREGAPPARPRASAVAALALGLGLGLALGPPALSAQESPHGTLALACDQCHTTTEWSPLRRDIPFRHDSTGFPLTGVHAAAACRECHTSLVFSRVATACADCHRDAHRGELGLNCASCHDTRRWDVRSEFFQVHNRTIFPLLGGHARVDCEACHKGTPAGQYALTPTECVACHLADYRAATSPPHTGFPTDCKQCHAGVPDGWRASGFAHTPRFPLTGAHAGLACAQCHPNGNTNIPADCYSCHRPDYERTRDPNHVSAHFPTACQVCHTTTTWDGARFDHATTGFVLEGAHRTLTCDQCHTRGYAGTPADCYSCHRTNYQNARDPNHVAAGFPTTCQTCHSTTVWQPASFDHARTAFPLTGAHARAACASCHANGYTGTPRDCYSCHRTDYQNTRDPNHAQAGYPTTCQNCHNTSSWGDANFNHAAAGFPLTGAHASAPCAGCHASGYAGTPHECYACHRTDYENTRDPNHVQAGYSTSCQNCHSTTRWGDANFNHSTSGFPLTGAHTTTPCASCHAGGYAGTPHECYACHRTDYENTRDPNHVQAGYPTTCQNCHSTTRWEDASFNHSTTSFPLTGAHTSTPCASCHANGYAGTPTQCFACHQADYNNTTDPNHAAAGFPTTCQNCHTTTRWGDASFNHSSTGFPLTGAHVTTPCLGCHAGGYSGTPTQCFACHQADYNNTTDPNHAAAGFPTTCQTCHNTTGWSGATFDHDASFFPIYSGAHRGTWSSCATCHTSGSNYRAFTCIVCHEHSRSNMDSAHSGVPNYQYESQACYGCHPDGRH